MKSQKLWMVVLVLFFGAMACARTSVPAVATSQPSPASQTSLPEGQTTRSLTHDGIQRSYILYVPASYNSAEPASVVLVFHGGAGNAEGAIRMTGFNALADEKGFIVVYPNGTGRLEDKILTWNGGTCCGWAQAKNVDDVGFVRVIVADLQGIASIDMKRIYATGISNGGIMSHRLACEASDLIAAIGPVSGTLNLSPCLPAQPVSVIEFHGTADQHILYDGGAGPQSLVGVDFVSVRDSVGFWATFDGCASQPQTNSLNDIQHEAWSGCAGNSSVELYTIIDGLHAWPGSSGPGWLGGDVPTQSISATKLIWDFFAAHPKP